MDVETTKTERPFIGVVPFEGQHYGFQPAIAATMDDYNPYDYTTRLGYYELEATEFYDEANKLWITNPFCMMVVEWLINEVFGNGIHFEGPGAEEAELKFREDRTIEKLKTVLRHAILYGNGYLGLKVKGKDASGRLMMTQEIDTRGIKVEWKNTSGAKDESNYKYLQLSAYTGKATDTTLNKKYLVDFRLKKDPSDKYGLSLIRPNVEIIRAMWDIAMDVPAAVKRIAYSPVVVGLNLEGYPDQASKEAALESFSDMYKDNLSAVTNYVIDQKHELSLLGSSGASAQLLPIRDLIEPLLSVMLVNFGFPIGFFLQQGANKAIVEEQNAGVRNFINEIKRQMRDMVNLEVMPLVSGDDTTFEFSVKKIENQILLRRLMLEEYALGLISKEYYHEQADIWDTGTTFVEIPSGTERKPSYREAEKY